MVPLTAAARRPIQGGGQIPHNSLQDRIPNMQPPLAGSEPYAYNSAARSCVVPAHSIPSNGQSIPTGFALPIGLPEPRMSSLHDRFERIKEIGDGSFGSVVRACERRCPSSQRTRPGPFFAIKIIKKPFHSLRECNELREVIFLRTLPAHNNLVPVLDIFLDRPTRQLHIVMEFMDCNLYQLMKSREGRIFPSETVRSILRQIMAGLQHIHHHQFFHRDIKPENILVSTAPVLDPNHNQIDHRFSAASATPPATPQNYIIKLADFGLAREIGASGSYTTYVSTRWYRAPEVLFHARRYSAPVDIWAVGAMAAEIATLKPLFPGNNEVDQVYRICALRGSPDGHYPTPSRPSRASILTRHMLSSPPPMSTSGGEWLAGVEMASKVGVKLYRLHPRALTDVLGPNFPKEFYDFIDCCLKWDPNHRPTSDEALGLPYLSTPSNTANHSRLSNRRTIENLPHAAQNVQARASWLKRTLGVSSTHAVLESAPPVLTERSINIEMAGKRHSDQKDKSYRRTTWANSLMGVVGSGHSQSTQAPPAPVIVPSPEDHYRSRKENLGRQLSVVSITNSQAEMHRLEAERALNGQGPSGAIISSSTPSAVLSPPPSHQRESFFSHLRKRARRMSGRPSLPLSPDGNRDPEGSVSVGCVPWASNSNRNSVAASGTIAESPINIDGSRCHRPSIDGQSAPDGQFKHKQLHRLSATSLLRRRSRHQSVPAAHPADNCLSGPVISALASSAIQNRQSCRPAGEGAWSSMTGPLNETRPSKFQHGNSPSVLPVVHSDLPSDLQSESRERLAVPVDTSFNCTSPNLQLYLTPAHSASTSCSPPTCPVGVIGGLSSLALYQPVDPQAKQFSPSLALSPMSTTSDLQSLADHHSPRPYLPHPTTLHNRQSSVVQPTGLASDRAPQLPPIVSTSQLGLNLSGVTAPPGLFSDFLWNSS